MAAIATAIALAGYALLQWQRDSVSAPSSEQPAPTASLQVAEPSVTASPSHDHPEPASASRDQTEVAATRAAPPGAVPGEYLLHFADEAAWRAFLAHAAAEGYHILDTLDALRTVRLRGQAPLDLPEGAQEAWFNTWVRVPEMPPGHESSPGTSGQPFGRSAATSVGWSAWAPERGAGAHIALLDTGFDPQHPQLAGADIQLHSLLTSTAPSSAETEASHGLALVAVLAAQDAGLNSLVPAVRMDAWEVLDDAGQGTAFTLAQGLVAAADRGAQVISLSLGGYDDNPVLREAVAYAQNTGAVLVAAVGNEGTGYPMYPAAYPDVIGVASVDAAQQLPTFNNYGDWVDVVAPGVGVTVLPSAAGELQMSGTSVAVPFVTGLIAELLSAEPALTPTQAAVIVLAQADDTWAPGRDLRSGEGVINRERVVRRNQAGVQDVAVAAHYVDPEAWKRGQAPVFIAVENRGTAWVPEVKLQVDINGQLSEYRLKNLEVGATGGVQVYYDTSGLLRGESVEVRSYAEVLTAEPDINPDNNGRWTRLQTDSQ